MVILSPSSENAQKLYDDCQNLISNMERMLVCYGGGYEQTQEVYVK